MRLSAVQLEFNNNTIYDCYNFFLLTLKSKRIIQDITLILSQHSVAHEECENEKCILPFKIQPIFSSLLCHFKVIGEYSGCQLSPSSCFILYDWTARQCSGRERLVSYVRRTLTVYILTHFGWHRREGGIFIHIKSVGSQGKLPFKMWMV